MSFEGYYVWICANGHEDYEDVYGEKDRDAGCQWSECGEPIAWEYTVDQTNNSGIVPTLEEFAPNRFYIPFNCGRLLVDEKDLKVAWNPVTFRHLNLQHRGVGKKSPEFKTEDHAFYFFEALNFLCPNRCDYGNITACSASSYKYSCGTCGEMFSVSDEEVINSDTYVEWAIKDLLKDKYEGNFTDPEQLRAEISRVYAIDEDKIISTIDHMLKQEQLLEDDNFCIKVPDWDYWNRPEQLKKEAEERDQWEKENSKPSFLAYLDDDEKSDRVAQFSKDHGLDKEKTWKALYNFAEDLDRVPLTINRVMLRSVLSSKRCDKCRSQKAVVETRSREELFPTRGFRIVEMDLCVSCSEEKFPKEFSLWQRRIRLLGVR